MHKVFQFESPREIRRMMPIRGGWESVHLSRSWGTPRAAVEISLTATILGCLGFVLVGT